jgi:hypothetical protein
MLNYHVTNAKATEMNVVNLSQRLVETVELIADKTCTNHKILDVMAVVSMSVVNLFQSQNQLAQTPCTCATAIL